MHCLDLTFDKHALIDEIPVLIRKSDLNGKSNYFNKTWLQFTGRPIEDEINDGWLENLHPEDLERYLRSFLEAKRIYQPMEIEYRLMRYDGEYRWIYEITKPIIAGDGTYNEFLASCSDRTSAKKAEAIEKKYQIISEKSSNMIVFFRLDGSIAEANTAARKAYGYSREELLTMNIKDLRAPLAKTVISDKLSQEDTRRIVIEAVHRRKDGSPFPVEVISQASLIGEEKVILAIITDLTEQHNVQEKITRMEYYDNLTQLPNRALFMNRLEETLSYRSESTRLAVMILNLDNFKQYNELYGQHIGDNLLKKISRRLKRTLRATDTVSRIGTDEFAILISQLTDTVELVGMVTRIFESFKTPYLIDQNELQVTVSMGISLYPDDGTTPEILCTHAAIALYRAKEHNYNSFQLYDENIGIQTKERMQMEHNLRQALKRKELEVYYQPQVDLDTRQIIGAEALLRWRHLEKGLIAPGEFVHIAEESGLILPIGEWVMQTACQQNKLWQNSGLAPIRMSVNISALQFKQKNFVEIVSRVLTQSGLHPTTLELEITESIAADDVLFTIDVLQGLRDMGVSIALDDFGTGYSSLNYLKRFPVNTLKIDKSFVEGLPENRDDGAITSTIIALAENFKINVIAEGVETEEQLQYLKMCRCPEAQGYLFGRPMPAEEFEKLLVQQGLNTKPFRHRIAEDQNNE